MKNEAAPVVSVVVATYNRSDVLRCALESLRGSTLEDWEAWVVGDACTDDTEEVVASFADPRLRFVNLESNHGEQSKPNNEGVSRSRGRYLAFLNHDDLYLPHHLERCVAELEKGDLDLAYGLAVAIHPGRRFHLTGATRSGRFDMTGVVAASTWVLRRELFERIGPWRSFRECHAAPSKDWLCRAAARGAALGTTGEVSVLRFPSTSRPDSYRESARYCLEQQHALERVRSTGYLAELLTQLAIDAAASEDSLPVWRPLRRAVLNAGYRTALALGVDPQALRNRVRFGRRGGLIDKLRRVRGLPPAQ